ncbi:hypothetical protein GCM10025867_19830 [Frondihabitans sucicola]|uniref:Uncharacterized protein n=1 Tax=Frondihabitans sucicola TaxID=1268041 RepID=A0ABM8GMW8_9MICO|nr:hypothetical protein [Frondihabitans sucicola]BDZ49742.1 hypothetical protein GCM10025867_19830 [Frondihabitans sucicola]
MPHIVYAGQRIAISTQQLVDIKDRLREAAAAAQPLELDVLDTEGNASWLFWTPGAPMVINDGDVPALPEFPFPDLSALGFPAPPEAPQQRRVGF